MDCCNKNKKNFTDYSIVKAGKSIIKHYTDPAYNAFSEKEEKKRRMEICLECEMVENFLGKKRCKVCLCFIDPKTSLVDQTCPHPKNDKWLKKELH